MKAIKVGGYQVVGDNRTVWVNGPDGVCVARFSFKGGVDIHKSMSEQIETGNACLDCKAGPATRADLEHFLTQVALLFGVAIPERFWPKEAK